MQTEVLDLMRTHGCFQGLAEDALAEIAEHMEVVRCRPNEYVHQPNTPLPHIYFIVQGILTVTHRDLRGNEKVLGTLSRDDQFGAITGGALSDSLQEGVVARTNCTLLKLEHEKALIFAPKYPSSDHPPGRRERVSPEFHRGKRNRNHRSWPSSITRLQHGR
jgi:signal-transduction protein with cAMP-binding, CBS, and nucleotidyltransferase domain